MRWRPYLDLQIVQHSLVYERGIPRYAAELSCALLDAGVPVAAIALNGRLPFPKRLPPGLAQAPQLTWNTSGALRKAMEKGPTLYHVFAPFEGTEPGIPWLPLQVARRDAPLVVSVYDLIPEVMGLLRPRTRAERFYRIRRRLLAHADLLLAISEQTRRDVIERVGVPEDRVCVVGAGCSDYFRPARPEESPDALIREELPAIDRPFVLTVSAWEPRKNTELLIDGFASLPRDLRDSLQLVVACNLPPEGREKWSNRARRHGLRDHDVVFTGFVADRLLRGLYQTTELFVDPSRYEGFGLPVLEAARCGAPCVVAQAPGLEDVLGWEPARFELDDPDGLATLIQRGISDDGFRSRLLEVAAETAGRNTWDRVAQRTAIAYGRIEHPTGRRRIRPRMRVAFVGPFPPVRTGIAQYNAGVTAHLAEHCELDCFVDAGDWVHDDILHEKSSTRLDPVGPRRPIDSRARWLPARALGHRIDPARYDAIVYAIGNSWFHHDTLPLARKFSGIVWFHDVDLTGLYITYAHRLLSQPAGTEEALTLFRDVLSRYGPRGPDVDVSETDTRWSTYEPYRRTGVRFTVDLARDASACIVASERARAALELDAGPAHLLPPVHLLPLAVPNRARRRDPIVDPPRVVSLGRQDLDAKQPETVLEAMALVARSQLARLTFVGEIRPDLRARLSRRAERLDIAHMIEITGYVADGEYQQRLEEASCAVQLRHSSANGEGSAAVNDALALGLPVITNLASSRELPPASVQHLPEEPTPRELADEILRVLNDSDHRRQLGDGALRYARTWSFDRMTEHLLEIIDITRTARTEQWVRQLQTA